MANKIFWSKTLLAGGTSEALDSIDGDDLTDGDFAHIAVNGVWMVYKLDADSGESENVPEVIAPDANAGDKRWILQKPDENYIDARAHGAKGDGSTDNAAAIAEAVEVARSSGYKRVRLGNGSFLTSDPVPIDGIVASDVTDGIILEGLGMGATELYYVGDDYALKFNSEDSSAGRTVRSCLRNMTITGTGDALGALRISSYELLFENLFITGFTNELAEVIYSYSAANLAYGCAFRNVILKHNTGALAAMKLVNYTWTILDRVYLSNNGTYGLVLGSGVSANVLSTAIESHTYGLVASTGVTGSSGPIEALNINGGCHFESNTYDIDLNNAITPSAERIYNANIIGNYFSSGTSIANNINISIGLASYTKIDGNFIYAPSSTGDALVQILSDAVSTDIGTNYVRTVGGRATISDLGTGTRMSSAYTTYTPTWTANAGTSPAIGNGSLSGDYRVEGRVYTVNLTLIGGSGTTWGDAGQAWIFSLPATVKAANRAVGSVMIRQNSSGLLYSGICYADASGSTIRLVAGAGVGSVSASVPFSFTASDRVDITITFEKE